MGSKWKLTPWLMAGLLLAAAVGCVSEDEVKRGKYVLTWDMIARAIDQQLGMTSDGTAQTCNGQGPAVGLGGHCKDQLQGLVTQSTVVQYVEVWNDTVLFGGVMPFYFQGFMPVTTSPCLEDVNPVNGTPDYLDACISGTVTCDIVNGHVELDYTGCQWQEPGPDQWMLDGNKNIYVDLNASGEELLIIRSTGFTATNLTTNATYDYSGDAVRYFWLNPFTGGPALGSTGLAPDGMELVDVNITVDEDGPGADASNNYNLKFANDYEDGFFFYANKGVGVWLSNPGAAPLTFYEAGRPWDLTGTGCLVDVLNLNTVNRTFDISSQGAYAANGCIPDAVGVNY